MIILSLYSIPERRTEPWIKDLRFILWKKKTKEKKTYNWKMMYEIVWEYVQKLYWFAARWQCVVSMQNLLCSVTDETSFLLIRVTNLYSRTFPIDLPFLAISNRYPQEQIYQISSLQLMLKNK